MHTKAGGELTMAYCHFGAPQFDFLVLTITLQGVTPQELKKIFSKKSSSVDPKKLYNDTSDFLNTTGITYPK